MGQQKREQVKKLVTAGQTTATFLATTYVSPTPSPTPTFTPGPPTATPVVYIDYVVAPGDSCLSIATRFNIYVDSLVSKNGIDCSLLNIGTLLKIPPPVPTQEPTNSGEGTAVP
jgi:LysM repeat protein